MDQFVQYRVLIFLKVSPTWLNIYLVLTIAHCRFVLFMSVLQLKFQVGPSGQLVTKDSLVYPEVRVDL